MQILDIIKKYHQDLWREQNSNVIFDVFIDNAKIHSPLKTVVGSHELKNVVDTWLRAFPDLEVSWDQLLSSDDKVVSIWHATGTHKDTFLDIPATNKKINYQGVTIYEFDKDKVKEYWAIVDIDAVKKQLSPV